LRHRKGCGNRTVENEADLVDIGIEMSRVGVVHFVAGVGCRKCEQSRRVDTKLVALLLNNRLAEYYSESSQSYFLAAAKSFDDVHQTCLQHSP